MQRYFAQKMQKDKLILSAGDIHHITKVMRMKINDQIEIVFNKKVYLCEITSLDKEPVFNILNIEEKEITTPYLTIAFGLVKEQKLDYILQKASELGVNEIIPLIMTRNVVKVNDKIAKKVNRWQMICKEASEQSFRSTIPLVTTPLTLKELSSDYDLKLVCSTKENVKSLKTILQTTTKCDRILIVIGPEGGITNEEEEYLLENGFKAITLGQYILRVETVPLVILSMINYELME